MELVYVLNNFIFLLNIDEMNLFIDIYIIFGVK